MENNIRKLERARLSIRFDVLEKPVWSANSVRLIVRAETGIKRICCSKRTSVYSYLKDGQLKREAWIPEWLAEKAGLI